MGHDDRHAGAKRAAAGLPGGVVGIRFARYEREMADSHASHVGDGVVRAGRQHALVNAQVADARHGRLAAQDGPGQAGCPALGLKRHLVTAIGQHLAARLTQTVDGLDVVVEHQHLAGADGQDIGAHGHKLLVGNGR